METQVAALEALFREVAATRMDGVPVLHAGLAVKAVGFERIGDGAVGVLVTPWFMNLVWLPLEADAPPLAIGASRARGVGHQRFDFIGAFEAGFGAYEACSLFSPMFEFEDQAAALATAQQVLAILRAPPPAPEAPAVPSRRALLFGRPAEAAR
jgi:[NiFe] hydrogenase assembly HybE family chaperone